MAISKYRVEVEFSLETQIEPEGIDHQIRQAVDFDNVDDNSYFSTQEVEVDGGSISFDVEAEDEDDAQAKAEEAIFDGQEFEDYNGFTWVVSKLTYNVEQISWEPTVEEAIEVLRTFVAESVGADEETGRVATAARVVLDDHARLSERVGSLEHQMSSLHTRVAELNDEVARLVERLNQQG